MNEDYAIQLRLLRMIYCFLKFDQKYYYSFKVITQLYAFNCVITSSQSFPLF